MFMINIKGNTLLDEAIYINSYIFYLSVFVCASFHHLQKLTFENCKKNIQ